MSTNNPPTARVPPPTAIDWNEVTRTALGSAFFAGLIGGALHVLGKVIDAEMQARAASPVQEPSRTPAATASETEEEEEEEDEDDDEEDDAREAAQLLGVSLNATDSEIRAALRSRLASSRIHPDHGGDGAEAKRVINAKNFLIERLRAQS